MSGDDFTLTKFEYPLLADGDLAVVLTELYRSEINASVASFWDGGWTVHLGDDMNGHSASANFDGHNLYAAGRWLAREACRRYPTSAFALRYLGALGRVAVVPLGDDELNVTAAQAPKKPAERMTTKNLADKILAGLTVEQQTAGFTLADAGLVVPGQRVGKLEAACNRLVTAGVLVRVGDGYRKMPFLSAAPPVNGAGAEA